MTKKEILEATYKIKYYNLPSQKSFVGEIFYLTEKEFHKLSNYLNFIPSQIKHNNIITIGNFIFVRLDKTKERKIKLNKILNI